MEGKIKYLILSADKAQDLQEEVNKYLDSTIVNKRGSKVAMYKLHGETHVLDGKLVQAVSINGEATY